MSRAGTLADLAARIRSHAQQMQESAELQAITRLGVPCRASWRSPQRQARARQRSPGRTGS